MVPRAVEAERARFLGLLDTLPVYIILLSRDHHIPYMNRFFRERFGDSGGRKCFEYLFHRDRPCEDCKSYDTLKKKAPLEWEWTGPDGRNYYIYDFPFKEADGTTLILEVGLDVTAQKRAQEELRRAGVYNRSLIEVSLDPVVTIGADGRITDINHATEAATGLPRERLIGTDFATYFTEPDKARDGYKLVFGQGAVRDYPLDLRHRDGHVTPVLYNASVFKDASGGIVGVFAAARDISDLKRVEDELRRHKEHLERLVKVRTGELERKTGELDAILTSIADPVVVYDKDRVPVRLNTAARELLGYENRMAGPAQSGGPPERGPDDSKVAVDLVATSRALEGETVRNIEYTLEAAGGGTKTFLGSSAPVKGDGGVAGAVTTLHDITDLKEADRALHELVSELATVTGEAVRRADELDSILSSIGEPVVVFDRDGDPMKANPTFRAFFGFDPLGLSGPELHGRLGTRQDRPAPGVAKAAVREALGGVPVKDREQETTDGRGSPRTMLVSCSPVLIAGKPAGAVCSWHDITDRKKAESEILYLASFPELAPIPVLEFDAAGELTFENAAATKILEILGTMDPSKLLPATPASLFERLKGKKHESVYGEVAIGDRIYGENIYIPEGTDRLRAYAMDITEQKRMEARLEGWQQELEAKNSQLQALFDFSAASLALFDARPPYTVLAHNRYYQQLWAEPFRSRGLVGKNLLDYVPGVEVQGVIAVYDEVVRTKTAKNILNFPYDGLERGRTWWNWHLSPIMRGDKVIALAHVAFDVTSENLARQKAEEAARMLEEANKRLAYQADILANVRDAIFATDADTTITFWNRAAEELYGWKAEEALGRPSGELLRATVPGSTRDEILRKLLAEGKWTGKIVHHRKDGRPITVEARAMATRDAGGKMNGILSVNREIPDRERPAEER